MTAYVTLDGQPVASAVLTMPARGPWWAEVDMELAPTLGTGAIALRIGEREWSGTIDAARSNVHMERARALLIGGAGSWGRPLRAKHYHSDSGVRARAVIEDAARECGERVSVAQDVAQRVLGIDYVRQAGTASRALEDALAGAVWWVDADGVTQVAAERPTSTPDASTYEVLDFDLRTDVAVVAVDDVAAIGVGSVLAERLTAPQTVREVELTVTADAVRIRARCSTPADQLARLFRSAVQTVTSDRLFGCWRYRVTQRSGDRVELQSVRTAAGLPDILPVSMWPGVAGAHATLALGAEVLVEFVEGDRTQPIVRGFVGKGGAGATPESLALAVSSEMLLGGPGAVNAVALANLVRAEFVKLQATLLTGTSPSGAVTFGTVYTAPTSDGAIGATKVKAE